MFLELIRNVLPSVTINEEEGASDVDKIRLSFETVYNELNVTPHQAIRGMRGMSSVVSGP